MYNIAHQTKTNMRHIGLNYSNNTLAPQTNEKWILGSHDFIANARLGSSSANGGSFADGCGLLPEIKWKYSKYRRICLSTYYLGVYKPLLMITV